MKLNISVDYLRVESMIFPFPLKSDHVAKSLLLCYNIVTFNSKLTGEIGVDF